MNQIEINILGKDYFSQTEAAHYISACQPNTDTRVLPDLL